MPSTLTGVVTAITSRFVPTVQAPAGGDRPSASSNNQPDQSLLDLVASLLASAGLLGVASTWSALQTITNLVAGALSVTGAAAFNTWTAATGTLTDLNVNGRIALTSNPAASTGISNQLHAKNTPKAWALLHSNGSGGMVVDDGFNVASAAVVNGGRFSVTFATALANANYAVMVVSGNTSGETIGVSQGGKNGSGFTVDIPVQVTSSGTPAAWGSTPSGGYLVTGVHYFQVVVFGDQ